MRKFSIFLALAIFLVLLLKLLTSETQEEAEAWASLPNSKIGAPVPKDATNMDSQILVSPSQFLPTWKWSYEGAEYSLGVDKNGKIQHISTTSTRVKTSSGVYVGMSLSELRNILDVELGKLPGWAWSAALPSGWNAGFTCGESFTDCKPGPNDEIAFIYDSP